MAFTAADVKNLREMTGCGMMDCKKALTEADGDMDKAVDILREKGLAASQKKAGRIAAEGTVYALVEGNTGVVIEVNAETDFVAKNAEFMAFVDTCAKTVIAENPADVEALLACKAVGSDMTIDEMLKEKILVIGENIKIRRFEKYEGAVVTYIHGGGRIGVMVKFDTTDEIAAKPEFTEFGKDIAMQIAALNPKYRAPEDMPAEELEKEKAILMEQIHNDPKSTSSSRTSALSSRRSSRTATSTWRPTLPIPPRLWAATSPSFPTSALRRARVSRRERTISPTKWPA